MITNTSGRAGGIGVRSQAAEVDRQETGPRLCDRAPRTVRARLMLALILGTAFWCTACVKYIPVELEAVPPEEEVLVRLTDEGALRAARHFGKIRSELDGFVAPRPPDSLTVSVWLGKNYPGTQFENVHETVVFPRYEVADLHLRRLSKPRTAAALAGAAIVFALLVDQIFLQENPNRPPGEEDENPPPATLPLIRIPIGRTP